MDFLSDSGHHQTLCGHRTFAVIGVLSFFHGKNFLQFCHNFVTSQSFLCAKKFVQFCHNFVASQSFLCSNFLQFCHNFDTLQSFFHGKNFLQFCYNFVALQSFLCGENFFTILSQFCRVKILPLCQEVFCNFVTILSRGNPSFVPRSFCNFVTILECPLNSVIKNLWLCMQNWLIF